MFSRAVVPNLGPPDVLGLQLPEILASRDGGEGFWELQSKNIWRPKIGDHCSRSSQSLGDEAGVEGVRWFQSVFHISHLETGTDHGSAVWHNSAV